MTFRFKKKKSLLKDYELIADSASRSHDPATFIGNPVNAFLLIKKLTRDLDRIVNDTLNTYPTLMNVLTEMRDRSFTLPSDNDYTVFNVF
jgi:hypothetical protein